MTAIETLIIQERYAEALAVAKEELKKKPGDHTLLMWCADLYSLTKQTQKAVDVYSHVAGTGSAAKAVVALKKIEQLGSENDAMYQKVAERISQEEPADIPTLTGFVIDENDRLQKITRTGPVEEVQSPLFDDFSQDELLAFIRGLELQLFDPGDIIVGEGEPGDSLYILTSGMAKAFVRKNDGNYERVRTLHDGDFFGEISILNGGFRTATITAATRCELLELDRKTLDAISASHPGVRRVMESFRDERVADDRAARG